MGSPSLHRREPAKARTARVTTTHHAVTPARQVVHYPGFPPAGRTWRHYAPTRERHAGQADRSPGDKRTRGGDSQHRANEPNRFDCLSLRGLGILKRFLLRSLEHPLLHVQGRLSNLGRIVPGAAGETFSATPD